MDAQLDQAQLDQERLDQVQFDQDNHPILGNLIFQKIAENSRFRINFAEFMELALYHPLHGYYASKATQIGGTGADFFTAPHLGSDFGELLAEQFVQMWDLLGHPTPFTLVEMGAGQGLLAKDVLCYLQQSHPVFFDSLEYIIIERAAALIAEQQRQLQFLGMGDRLRWCGFDQLAPNSITGCFFSNELVDALPVHQIVAAAGQLQEVYVTAHKGNDGTIQFAEIADTLSTTRLEEYFARVGINLLSSAYPQPYRSEVNLAALDWMATVADKLQQGYVLTIDYGYLSDRYYHPMRSEGTLQCYYQHKHHSDPYIHVGDQDITAHVDFTALQRQGEQCGLQTLGFTKQGMFLMALGVGDRLAAIGQSNASQSQQVLDSLRRREALHQLVNPMGLGNFGVLIQGKGVDPTAALRGLRQE